MRNLIFLLILLFGIKPSFQSTVQNWREVLLFQCALSQNEICPKNISYNETAKKEEELKTIDNFDEWTKKRRAVNNQQQQQQQQQQNQGQATIVQNYEKKPEEVLTPTRPTRNFASKECGAKIIAANPEAENAKAVVNEKDIDDYMRNPCESAKEKFIVIELCETIQVKKLAIGNFELFASRPKQISVQISERYPPLKEWVSLGTFHLQDHHKKLQTFDVPQTNVYAKFVRINLEDHYGKEHYCIVSVVNVMGSTLADEYEKEEAAVHLLNVISESTTTGTSTIQKIEEIPKVTPPPAEIPPTQLPLPPKVSSTTTATAKKQNALTIRQKYESCLKCWPDYQKQNQSHYICWIWPQKQQEEHQKLAKKQPSFAAKRRRNLARVQRFLRRFSTKATSKTVVAPKLEPILEEKIVEEAKEEVVQIKKEPSPQSPSSSSYRQELDTILPAGGSIGQRETVLIKLTKRIAAVELNLTLSTEYLSELSKQYVSQMSGYQEELKTTRKVALESVKIAEAGWRLKINNIRREMREIRAAIRNLAKQQEIQAKRDHGMLSYSTFFGAPPACHMTSQPASPLPRIGQIDTVSSVRQQFEESWRILMERAQSVIFGSVSWNTDHMIIALIATNIIAFSLLFAAFIAANRKNAQNCDLIAEEMRNEMRKRLAKYGNLNRKMIAKGLRRAELAVTAAVTMTMKEKKMMAGNLGNGRKEDVEIETTLANLFAAQQTKIDEQFAENKKLLENVLKPAGTGSFSLNDTMSQAEDSESSSETEHLTISG
ncbi:unnamed protein product [Caenorhabditis angaria]|uniref:SUN domain-containing protein n=1 Tax=Caenorhabditis angaria TaxID=860376 RepID=A0A9P1I421_9PELO|nr:unnamed protein product [Caenorhabditis angaria]